MPVTMPGSAAGSETRTSRAGPVTPEVAATSYSIRSTPRTPYAVWTRIGHTAAYAARKRIVGVPIPNQKIASGSARRRGSAAGTRPAPSSRARSSGSCRSRPRAVRRRRSRARGPGRTSPASSRARRRGSRRACRRRARRTRSRASRRWPRDRTGERLPQRPRADPRRTPSRRRSRVSGGRVRTAPAPTISRSPFAHKAAGARPRYLTRSGAVNVCGIRWNSL